MQQVAMGRDIMDGSVTIWKQKVIISGNGIMQRMELHCIISQQQQEIYAIPQHQIVMIQQPSRDLSYLGIKIVGYKNQKPVIYYAVSEQLMAGTIGIAPQIQ